MPRCKNCKQRFEPRYFLQKICDRDTCKSAQRDHQTQTRIKAAQKPQTRKPIKKVSGKQAKINTAYTVMNKQYLKDNPLCNVRSEVCTHKSSEVHHINGRGKNTLDTTTWVATCRYCHNYIHFVSPAWARANGFLK